MTTLNNLHTLPIHINHLLHSTIYFTQPSTSLNHPLQSSNSLDESINRPLQPFTSTIQLLQPSTSIIQFNQPPTSIIYPLESTTTTSLTVAGFGFRTIGRLVNQPSMNHLNHPPLG
ncbi:hypothetical protein N7501_000745 [Penicillium viridicatum]|nr:hypothetical protein N7501_000745 [Penicillium viridicatum]